MDTLINDLLQLKDLFQRYGFDYDQFVLHNFSKLQSHVDAFWAEQFAEQGYSPDAAAEAEHINATLGLESPIGSPFLTDHLYWTYICPPAIPG